MCAIWSVLLLLSYCILSTVKVNVLIVATRCVPYGVWLPILEVFYGRRLPREGRRLPRLAFPCFPSFPFIFLTTIIFSHSIDLTSYVSLLPLLFYHISPFARWYGPSSSVDWCSTPRMLWRMLSSRSLELTWWNVKMKNDLWVLLLPPPLEAAMLTNCIDLGWKSHRIDSYRYSFYITSPSHSGGNTSGHYNVGEDGKYLIAVPQKGDPPRWGPEGREDTISQEC